ncbi:AMP-binding protein [Salinirubellus salinus]|uniref:AMP-binding protein n=1 Tax=Salinirubellus salinus TaxID=1364945 RepID=A0A9E7UB44_9EURY|nr:AMP-binding protein [Salinirubellus salinus]UWM54454.1 AMP-binding protein [Salinirubellus salinus]
MADTPPIESFDFAATEWESYEQFEAEFEWAVPEPFNTATAVCDHWASDSDRVALFYETPAGDAQTVTYRELQADSNRLANYLQGRGVTRGDRVAVTGAQKPAVLSALVATWKLGAIAVPMSRLLGTEGLAHRLEHSEAVVFVVDEGNVDAYRALPDEVTADVAPLTVDVADPRGTETDLLDAITGEPAVFEPAATHPEDVATIQYTSGTTGDPKGVALAHRVVLGQLPAYFFTHRNTVITPDEVVWVIAEWSWIGLYAHILPSLFYGIPVVAHPRERFDPRRVFELIEKYGVTYCRMTPTAVRMMMQFDDAESYDCSSIRQLGIGGEKSSQDVAAWVDEVFDGPVVNSAYGQTETLLVTGECAALGKTREGSNGVPVPCRTVAVLDPETLEERPSGELGELAVYYEGDVASFSRYWNDPEATAEKVRDGWLLTGDLATQDTDGFVWFHSRKDDVIICSGYRIGPTEIEDCLAAHPAVADAGVVGVPDETRGEIPKAFVVLAAGETPSDALRETLQTHVKDTLAKYEYPRELVFIEDLPKTTNGKLKRSRLRDL